MSDTPMDVSYNATVTNPTPANPSSNINPGVGMKKPQYMLNQSRPTGPGIHNKPGVRIWSGSAFAIGKSITAEIIAPSTYQGCGCETCKEMNVDCPDCPVCANPIPEKNDMSEMKADAPLPENPIMPTNTYQKCECEMCIEQNIPCSSCPECSGGLDAETQMAMYDAQIGKADPCWEGYTQRGMKPGDNGRMVPNCIPVTKMDAPIVEGDFVIAMTTEGPVVGQVEHVMLEGGTYGQPGNPYSVESTPDNPAVAVRMLEEEDGTYYYTPYSIGALMSDINRINMPNISLEDYQDTKKMSKAEGYSPPAGARSAARRAIKFKEDGKANGAGTAVGWTRAGQLARGESLSLSTVKRMYSYFSRHEVDKKGKDWGNSANPSNGYIMWLAWGGDAGFSWSRSIVNREKDKALFSDFGKEYSKYKTKNRFSI